MSLLRKDYQRFDESDVHLMNEMLDKFHTLHGKTGVTDSKTYQYIAYLPVFAIALLASQESVDNLTKELVWLTSAIVALTVFLVLLTLVLLLKSP